MESAFLEKPQEGQTDPPDYFWLKEQAVIKSYICSNKFILVNNELREHDDKKEEIKNLRTSTVHQGF